MSVVQLENFRILKKVLMDLNRYGLNPYEWRFERTRDLNNQVIYLRHREDRDFRLYGIVDKYRSGKITLRDLGLASL
jgi:hypothetical protein